MTVEIFNPQLSDFTAEQLPTVLHSLYDTQAEMIRQRQSYKRVDTLARMFRDEIESLEVKIKDIDEIIVQFAGALQIKEKENRIQSN